MRKWGLSILWWNGTGRLENDSLQAIQRFCDFALSAFGEICI